MYHCLVYDMLQFKIVDLLLSPHLPYKMPACVPRPDHSWCINNCDVLRHQDACMSPACPEFADFAG